MENMIKYDGTTLAIIVNFGHIDVILLYFL